MRVETAGEVAYFRLSDRLRPAFGLDVDPFKAEGVPVDDAVYAAVSGASEMLGSSIADGLKEIEDGLLEALGLEVDEGVEDVGLVRSEWRGVRSERLPCPWIAVFAGITVCVGGSFDGLRTNGGVGFSGVG